jgi:DNA-binding transcriptional LysR family regulator
MTYFNNSVGIELMNIVQLQYLVCVIDKGSFADAAKEQHITPQAISRALSALENELRLELFKKTGRGVIPTQNALLLVEHANRILSDCDSFIHYAHTLSVDCCDERLQYGAAQIAVSSSPHEGGVVPKAFFETFKRKYPMIDLSVNYGSSSAGLLALQDGIIDLAVSLGRYKQAGFSCTKLFDSTFRVAISDSHPLSAKAELSIFDLREYPIAKPDDLRYCAPAIESHLSARNYSTPLAQLQPTIQDYSRFLTKDHGAIFVSQDPLLEIMYSNTKFIPLSKEDAIRIPVCFVYPEKDSTQVARLLLRNLLNQVKAEKIQSSR